MGCPAGGEIRRQEPAWLRFSFLTASLQYEGSAVAAAAGAHNPCMQQSDILAEGGTAETGEQGRHSLGMFFTSCTRRED